MKRTSVLLGVMMALVGGVPIAAQLSPRPTRPQVVPPPGPVRQVIFKYCTNCHGIDDYAYNSLDRGGWDAHLTAKHQKVDVPLPAADRAILLDWLAMRFGRASPVSADAGERL